MLVALSSCSGPSSQAVLPQAQTLAGVPTANGLLPFGSLAAPQAGKIQHVVYILQENRTFDNVFGGPNALPNVDAANTGLMSDGRQIALTSTGIGGATDPSNSYATWIAACNAPPNAQWIVGQPAPCRMNGFDVGSSNAKESPYLPYSYVDYSLTKPYFDMATKYAVADRFFASHNSESYTAHQYLFAGQSGGSVDSVSLGFAIANPSYNIPGLSPWGCDSPDGTRVSQFATPSQPLAPIRRNNAFPCWSYSSLPDLLNARNLTWRVYEPWLKYNIDSLDSIRSIRYGKQFPTGRNSSLLGNYYFRHPTAQFARDLNGGTFSALAPVTWFLPAPGDSDHAGPGLIFGSGAGYVADIINQIGRSPYWNSTVIFVTWDDWGGVYDHVPPYVVRDASGVGFRVPLLVISPYTIPGCVIHANNEFGTILKFAEDAFGLGSLGGVDSSAYLGNLNECFDWSAPRAFRPINEYGFNPQADALLEQQAIQQGISAVDEEKE